MYKLTEIKIFSKCNGSNHLIIDGVLVAKLCRCGRSKNMPLCDSTHKEINWIAEEKNTIITTDNNTNPEPKGNL